LGSKNASKNEILARERGITFEEIVERIESGVKVIETNHPNQKKYLEPGSDLRNVLALNI